MEVNKLINSINDAVSEVFDGSTIMIGGFGEAGSPVELIHSLIDNGSKNLTIIANNAGNGKIGLGALIGQRQVKKVICSFARYSNQCHRVQQANLEPTNLSHLVSS